MANGRPLVKGFFEKRTFSVQYVVADPETGVAAIIDPVLDFDPKSGATATHAADELLRYIRDQGYTLAWILDTHPHADHFSAAGYLRTGPAPPPPSASASSTSRSSGRASTTCPTSRRTARSGTGCSPTASASPWARPRWRLFTPGHTLASIAYRVGDAVFVHDTLFMPDGGTARADFPGGSAKELWASIQRILALPDDTRVFTGHDYMPGGREPRWESTVGSRKPTTST